MNVEGMHCQGCKNLITMSLEDEGLKVISLDFETGVTIFESEIEQMALKKVLENVFSQFESYSYSNLTQI
jgi:copper chaperone CopZ